MLELDSWAQDVTQHTAQEGQLPYPPPQSGPQANVRVDVARMTRNASERNNVGLLTIRGLMIAGVPMFSSLREGIGK